MIDVESPVIRDDQSALEHEAAASSGNCVRIALLVQEDDLCAAIENACSVAITHHSSFRVKSPDGAANATRQGALSRLYLRTDRLASRLLPGAEPPRSASIEPSAPRADVATSDCSILITTAPVRPEHWLSHRSLDDCYEVQLGGGSSQCGIREVLDSADVLPLSVRRTTRGGAVRAWQSVVQTHATSASRARASALVGIRDLLAIALSPSADDVGLESVQPTATLKPVSEVAAARQLLRLGGAVYQRVARYPQWFLAFALRSGDDPLQLPPLWTLCTPPKGVT